MKDLDHHQLCPMQCHMNSVLIDEIPKFLATQIKNPFDATHQIIIPLKLTQVTSYFEVRAPTLDMYEDQNILKIELMAESPPWDPFSPDLSFQEQSMFNCRAQFVSPNDPARDNYLSTLSHFILMMLQILWMMTTMPLQWNVLPIPHHCK